jgi:hypothetical protein
MVGMANWVKRIGKHCSGDLQPGENVVAGVILQKPGTTKRMAIGGGIGGAVGAAVASKMGNKDDGSTASGSGTAADFPDGPIIIGVTPLRVLVYSQAGMSGKPKELLATLTRREIASVEVGTGKVAKEVRLVFADGTAKTFETPGMDKSIGAFAAEFA